MPLVRSGVALLPGPRRGTPVCSSTTAAGATEASDAYPPSGRRLPSRGPLLAAARVAMLEPVIDSIGSRRYVGLAAAWWRVGQGRPSEPLILKSS